MNNKNQQEELVKIMEFIIGFASSVNEFQAIEMAAMQLDKYVSLIKDAHENKDSVNEREILVEKFVTFAYLFGTAMNMMNITFDQVKGQANDFKAFREVINNINPKNN